MLKIEISMQFMFLSFNSYHSLKIVARLPNSKHWTTIIVKSDTGNFRSKAAGPWCVFPNVVRFECNISIQNALKFVQICLWLECSTIFGYIFGLLQLPTGRRYLAD